MPKLRLGINIDHVATLRNARRRRAEASPDLLRAAEAAIQGGADGITVHLREDRRHILDDDVRRLKKNLRVPMNLEIAATPAMVALALDFKPYAVCLVPEKRRELTTEGGLDVVRGGLRLARYVNDLAAAGIEVALFIDPEQDQVMAAYATGARAVELHTGAYANSRGSARRRALRHITVAARRAKSLGLEVHAGHGLAYDNVAAIAAIPEVVELNIGHSLVGEAMFVGLTAAVARMRRYLNAATASNPRR